MRAIKLILIGVCPEQDFVRMATMMSNTCKSQSAAFQLLGIKKTRTLDQRNKNVICLQLHKPTQLPRPNWSLISPVIRPGGGCEESGGGWWCWVLGLMCLNGDMWEWRVWRPSRHQKSSSMEREPTGPPGGDHPVAWRDRSGNFPAPFTA